MMVFAFVKKGPSTLLLTTALSARLPLIPFGFDLESRCSYTSLAWRVCMGQTVAVKPCQCIGKAASIDVFSKRNGQLTHPPARENLKFQKD